MKAQRITGKNSFDSHIRNEERLETLIEFQRTKQMSKEGYIEKHQKKLSNYRIYIEELTTELAKVTQVVKNVGDGRVGGSHYNTSLSNVNRAKETPKCAVPATVSLRRNRHSDKGLTINESLSD